MYHLVRMNFYIHFTGKKEEVWVIDDLIIDGHSLNGFPILSESFDSGLQESNWLFYPGGNIDRYCLYQKSGLWVSLWKCRVYNFENILYNFVSTLVIIVYSMYREDDSALVFMSSELGEHSITTRNIDVNENTVLQFEVYS